MMTLEELKFTNALYDMNVEEWRFRGLAYKGGRQFLEEVIFQHTREEDSEYKKRLSEAYDFNYSATVINLLSHFLCSTPPSRTLGELGNREDWASFNENVDLKSTNFDVFMTETQKLASVYGTAGILCDKASGNYTEDDSVYPYLSSYAPTNILDWGFTRRKNTNSYELSFVKLRDSFNSILYWDIEKWERYIIDAKTGKVTEFETDKKRLHDHLERVQQFLLDTQIHIPIKKTKKEIPFNFST